MTTPSQSGALRYTAIVESSIESLEDPRVEGRTTHLLLNIMVISLLAVMCGDSISLRKSAGGSKPARR